MNLSDLLILKKISQSVVSLTVALVVLIGGWIVFSEMISPPPAFAGRALKMQPLGEVNRTPSAVAGYNYPARSIDVKKDIKVETIQIGCIFKNSNSRNFTSAARQVRLITKSCRDANTNLNESSIINRTNGYMATLFRLEKGEVSSDYITLTEGLNNIIFQAQNEAGERVTTEIAITRTEPY